MNGGTCRPWHRCCARTDPLDRHRRCRSALSQREVLMLQRALKLSFETERALTPAAMARITGGEAFVGTTRSGSCGCETCPDCSAPLCSTGSGASECATG